MREIPAGESLKKELHIQLLGGFAVSVGGVRIPEAQWKSRRGRNLVKLLALAPGHRLHRDQVCETFWPDSAPSSAGNNFHRTVYLARQVLETHGAGGLVLEESFLTLTAGSRQLLQIDVEQFEAAAALAKGSQDPRAYQEALACYTGDLLPDDLYEEWTLQRRESLRQTCLQLLLELGRLREARREYPLGIAALQKALSIEKCLEEAHAGLMRLYALSGQATAALAQFEICRSVLEKELGGVPSQETCRLREVIHAGKMDHLRPDRLLPSPGEAPYLGLRCFEEQHAALFFGREMLSARQAGRIEEMAESGSVQLVVVGASGSGKSSLVRAGVIPLLRQRGWTVGLITPGMHPLSALDRCGIPVGLEPGLSSRSLLVVDQFEELFSLCKGEKERGAFLERIFSDYLAVLLVLRADFYSHCALYPRLREMLSTHQEYIGAIDSAGLQRAIEEPARRSGWELEPGLVELILQDIGASDQHEPEPGALPLLGHALLETWQRRAGRQLTLEGYRAAGGVREAIARTAERVYACLEPRMQALARQVFLRLTEPGETSQDTRRRAALGELRALGGENSDVDGLLEALVEARLVTLGEGTAEVAHEALIREWPMLQGWLVEDREGLRLHRHLTESAAAWERLGRDPGELYRGARLARALEWASLGTNEQDLTSLEDAYLQSSREYAEAEAREREARRQRELEAAHTLAEEREQAAQRIQREERLAFARELAAHSKSALNRDPGLSLLLTLEAVDSLKREGLAVPWDVQQAVHDVALGLRLLWDIESQIQVRACFFSPDGKKLIYGDENGDFHILEAASGREIRVISTGTFGVKGLNPNVGIVASHANLLATMHTGAAVLWDLDSGQKWVTIPLPTYTDDTFSVAKSFSRDGRWLLVGIERSAGALIDLGPWLDAGSPYGTILHLPVKRVERCSLWSWRDHFHPDGKTFVTGSQDGYVYLLRDLETTQPFRTFRGHTDLVQGHCFSPDGSRLATCANDRTVRLWEVDSGRQLLCVPGHNAFNNSVEYSPDGQRLVTSGSDGLAILWDAHSLRRQLELPTGGNSLDANFSPDGERLFSITDASLRLWNVNPCGPGELGTYLPEVPLHKHDRQQAPAGAYIIGPLFESHEEFAYLQRNSPDGHYWIEPRPDGTVRLVDSTSFEQSANLDVLPRPLPEMCWPALSRDNRLLALRSDGRVEAWEVSSGKQLFTKPAADQWGFYTDFPPVFSPDGARLAAGCDDGAVSVWNLGTGDKELRLPVSLGWLSCCAFSPDGRYLAVSGAPDRFFGGGYVWTWDLSQADQPARVIHADLRTVYRIAFHPDSRRLAVCGWNQQPAVWDIQTGETLLLLRSHASIVTDIQYSPDGRWLVTSSWDGSARVWDAESGAELLCYRVPGQNRFDMAFFTPDGRRVVAVGDDGYYRLLAFQDFDEFVEIVRRRTPRDWKPEERSRYLREKVPVTSSQ